MWQAAIGKILLGADNHDDVVSIDDTWRQAFLVCTMPALYSLVESWLTAGMIEDDMLYALYYYPAVIA